MGLFGGGGFSFKNIFKGAKNIFGKVGSGLNAIGEGTLNVLTGGALAQAEATKEAKKARNQAQAQYQQQIAAAKAEANRIAKLEEERKRKLLLYGTQNPSTMIGGYLGIGGSANVSKPSLG